MNVMRQRREAEIALPARFPVGKRAVLYRNQREH
jgi:hypothetical protein